MNARRRTPLRWLLLLAFVGIPLVEVYVIVQVGQAIGPWWTIGLLILAGLLGTWLVGREGRRAFRALRDALNSGRMPARELADGALILIGGTLMLTPGFVTDLFALLLILPFTRPVARRALTAFVAKRLITVPGGSPGPGHPEGDVVPGEVVD